MDHLEVLLVPTDFLGQRTFQDKNLHFAEDGDAPLTNWVFSNSFTLLFVDFCEMRTVKFSAIFTRSSVFKLLRLSFLLRRSPPPRRSLPLLRSTLRGCTKNLLSIHHDLLNIKNLVPGARSEFDGFAAKGCELFFSTGVLEPSAHCNSRERSWNHLRGCFSPGTNSLLHLESM